MPAPIDVALGRRLAGLRRARGLSRESLAAALSTDAGRIADFETGRQRLSARDLVGVAAALEVPIAALFGDDLRSGNIVTFPKEPTPAEGHALMTAFFRIRDARARLSLLQMAEYLAL